MFRFFSVATDLRAAARSMVDVDYSRRYGLVAIRDETVVGQGLYFGDGPDDAEVAFAVADRLQGKGLATLLLAHLAEVASENGISVFWAEVMPQNHRMLEVFRESGFPVETSSEPGAIRVELPTSFADEAVGRFEDRDRLAAIAALRSFLEPDGGRRDRGLPQPRHRRRTALPQRARVRLRGRRLSGQPERGRGSGRACLPERRGPARGRRAGGDRGAGRRA